MSCPLCLGAVSVKNLHKYLRNFLVPFSPASLRSDAGRDLAAGTVLLSVFGSLCAQAPSPLPGPLAAGCPRGWRAFCPLLTLRCWHVKPQSPSAARWSRAGSLGSLQGLPHTSPLRCAILQATATVHTSASVPGYRPGQQLPRNHPCSREQQGAAPVSGDLRLGDG